ncbi:hypothetical protein [Niabella hirudinis]|uniref:hypothetical protein n=1 Tax=Niabella hirudinis TaxID=1285929 RepID=UPI003EC05F1B
MPGKIKHGVAWVMLVVFTISITPRIYLHDVFTHHKDQLFNAHTTAQKSIGAFEYSCGFINIESTSPFLEAGPFIGPAAPAFLQECFVQRTVNPFFRPSAHTALRGPPAGI